MAALPPEFIPNPPLEELKKFYVGKRLGDVPTPAAIVDQAVVERNCSQMLEACQVAGVLFRPHVKTHKTIEATALQVGKSSLYVNIIVSTLHEAEYLLPYLLECKEGGKAVNVLYGIPLPPSHAKRMGYLGQKLGPGSISILLDNPGQLKGLHGFAETAGFSIGIYIKVDTGYHRAGLPLGSKSLANLLEIIIKNGDSKVHHLCGFYSHAGHSYGVDDSIPAMDLLIQEIRGLEDAADLATSIERRFGREERKDRFVLSVGATPTATSIECLHHGDNKSLPQDWTDKTKEMKEVVDHANNHHRVELHAGVYPFLDMQQLATVASPSSRSKDSEHLVKSYQDVALTILAEVASTYEARNPPEAIIAAGSLALGREPCKSYSGWGVLTPWDENDFSNEDRYVDAELSNWFVARISQEHGVLQSRDLGEHRVRNFEKLRIGQKVRIFPNHACVAGAGFGYYLIVDSNNPVGQRDEIVDVWVRCRGW
ncbi:MAG: hypothetical protein MMC33_001337 [Icmadophila ericetorum]|nr:hypothetical protein [Icmadophila ericetorum]